MLGPRKENMDSVAAFQEVKQRFLSGLKKIWGAAFLIFVPGALYFVSIGEAVSILPLVGCLFFVCIPLTLILINKVYKCPNCGEVPKSKASTSAGHGPSGGILMNPLKCEKCGAKFEN